MNGIIKKIYGQLSRFSLLVIALLAVFLILAIGAIDIVSGAELASSAFYLAPIALATWFGGRRLGLIITFLSAAMWITADIAAGNTYANLFVPVWNTAVRLFLFLIFTLLIAWLHDDREKLSSMARTDVLTGIANSRSIHEQTAAELDRARRYGRPLTVVYIDIDNFKEVNDTLGHPVGDRLLVTVAQFLSGNIRSTDSIGRLGGDEFLVIIPEISPEVAKSLIQRIHKQLNTLMDEKDWPVSFSMGVFTFISEQISVDDIITRADQLMYQAKEQGKDRIIYDTF